HLAHDLGVELAVEPGQLAHPAAAGNDAEVGWVQGVADGDRDGAIIGDAELAAAVRPVEPGCGQPVGQHAHRTVEPDAADAVLTGFGVSDVERAAVGAPHRAFNATVEPGTDVARV